MRTPVVLMSIVLAAAAQPARHPKPVPAAPAPPVSAEPAPPEPAPPEPPKKVSIAPPDEPGWRTVEIPGGYYRYRTDERDPIAGAEAEPAVTVVPAVPPPPTQLQPVEPYVAPPEPAQWQPPPQEPPIDTRCAVQRQNLAQRVAYLQGFWTADGPTADVLLGQMSGYAYGAHLQRSFFGLPGLAWTQPNLLQIAAFDTPTAQLATEYAHCLSGE